MPSREIAVSHCAHRRRNAKTITHHCDKRHGWFDRFIGVLGFHAGVGLWYPIRLDIGARSCRGIGEKRSTFIYRHGPGHCQLHVAILMLHKCQ